MQLLDNLRSIVWLTAYLGSVTMPVVTLARFYQSWRTQWLFLLAVSIALATFSLPLALFGFIVLFHFLAHKNNPYSSKTYFQQPFSTYIENGQIAYKQNYNFKVYGSKFASLVGYYVSGFLIAKNTLTGGKPAAATTESSIIAEIHRQRFRADRPYLISGDQFSVLYPRNLGVFYNQLLNPAIAHDAADWQAKQQIYLHSVLVAIEGLSASSDSRTTIVPIGPRQAALTQVHPGGVGSDQVYGLLYALHALSTESAGSYKKQTVQVTKQLIADKKDQLQHILKNYLCVVQDPKTGLVKDGLHMASARDGVVRSSSFYDNIILWKTLELSRELGVSSMPKAELRQLKQKITDRYWNEAKGYFNDDSTTEAFSADWLIGFPTGFFDLTNATDLQRTERIVAYVESTNLVKPFPIKYQEHLRHKIPWFVKLVVPTYGGTAIWSYWGAEYITLLAQLHLQTGNKLYLEKAVAYQKAYAAKIVEDRGFAETFDENGEFLRTSVYKSIRITGWVVQYEYAVHLIKKATSFSKDTLE